MNSFCKSELYFVIHWQLIEHVDYLSRRRTKKKEKFQDFRRTSGFFLPLWWPCNDIYCLARDATAPAQVVMVLVDIRCCSETKNISIGTSGLYFRPVFASFWAYLWPKLLFFLLVVWEYSFGAKKQKHHGFWGLGNNIWHGCSSWQCEKSQGWHFFSVCQF